MSPILILRNVLADRKGSESPLRIPLFRSVQLQTNVNLSGSCIIVLYCIQSIAEPIILIGHTPQIHFLY